MSAVTHSAGRRGRLRDIALVIAGALAATLVTAVLAPLGSAGLYVLVALVVSAILVWSVRDELVPPLRAAMDRGRPGHRTGSAASRARMGVRLGLATVGAATLAWLAAAQGAMALAGLIAALVGGAAAWLLWPLITDVLRTPATDVQPRRTARSTGDQARSHSSRLSRAVGLSCVVVAAAVAAWAAAQLGLKGVLALVGACAVIVLLLVARDRSVVFTFLGVASLTFVLHKSFTSQDLQLSGGAISIYITTFDVVLLLLYGLWIAEGSFLADARAAFKRRIVWLPLAAALFLLPSVLVAPSPMHSAAELVRMGWMYLLYFYVAVRVRTRRHVWAVVAGLAAFAAIEFVVVLLQWQTGGVLGLSFLGVPTQLSERVTDTDVLGRPFGTIIHPVFMGAVLGVLALVALALAIDTRRSLTKFAAAIFVPVCLLPLYLAHTRASLVAVMLPMGAVVAYGLRRGRLTKVLLGRTALVLLGTGLLLLPQLSAKFSENFGTAHFFEEVASRLELNEIALHMIDDHWGIGVGLNNFELVMPAYESHRVIFFNNPVHNVYLLWLAETGVVGFAAVAVLGGVLGLAAIRLARSRDRLLGAVGVGVAAAMAFICIEELLGFSLRQDIPLAMYWLLAGLVVACLRIVSDEQDAGSHRGRDRRPKAPVRRAPARVRAGATSPDPAADVSLDDLLAPRSADDGRARRAFPLLWPRVTAAGRSGSAGRVAVGLAGHLIGNASARGLRWAAIAGALVGLVPLAPASTASATDLTVAFRAVIRDTGEAAIFVARGDGSGRTRITPSDGRTYSWPRWAFDSSKIVFTMRSGPPGSPESIALMNPDGSDVQTLATFQFQVGQPQIDPAGRWLYFTAMPPWFPRFGVFRMDLRTLESTNLTGVTMPLGGADTDPALSYDGQRIVMTSTDTDSSDITLLSADGHTRTRLTDDGHYNADPVFAPDGSTVAISSYRGPGKPGKEGGVQPGDWRLVTADVATGQQRVLTQGVDCTARPPTDPCTVQEMSAFVPRYLPDGSAVAFDGALDRATTCICVIDTDGSAPRVLFASVDLAIGWFDLTTQPRGGDDPDIGSGKRSSKVLVTMSSVGEPNELVLASPDLMHRDVLPLPEGLVPEQARLAPDGRTVVFTARTAPRDADRAPHPSPPPGSRRRDHVTLNDISALAIAQRAEALAAQPADADELQVFIRYPDGTVRQLTDPWLEDWRDGVPPGDARANTDPCFTSDGTAVIVTNTSTLTGESLLLRIDLDTGAVLNLTNATAGALAVDDANAATSPDGRYVAFSWTQGTRSDIYVMAPDGYRVVNVTSDEAADAMPTWLPDGSGLVYASDAGAGVRLSRVSFTPEGLSAPLSLTGVVDPAPVRPVVAPEGDRILYAAKAESTRSVFAVSPTGGTPRLLQPDPTHNVAFVDWR